MATAANPSVSNQVAGSYLARAQRAPRLTREEEVALSLRAQSGDRAASDALITAHLRHVVAIALRYRSYPVMLADLISEGNLGLLMAVKRFDPHRGTRFSTYAAFWIRAYMLEHIVRSTTSVGAGTGPLRSKLFFRLRRERARLAAIESDPQKRLERLAHDLGVSTERAQALLDRLGARDISLESTHAYHDSAVTLRDTIPDAGQPQDEQVIDAEWSQLATRAIDQALTALDRRERMIVERRLLTDSAVTDSLAALGSELGISRERVRQIEARAIRKLRDRLVVERPRLLAS